MLDCDEEDEIIYLLTHHAGRRPGSPSSSVPGNNHTLTLQNLEEMLRDRPYLLDITLSPPHSAQMLLVATKAKNLAACTLLLSLGANVKARDPYGFTALHIAVRGGGKDGLEIAKLLLKYGAEVDARDASYHKTPLLYACREMATEMALLLIEVSIPL